MAVKVKAGAVKEKGGRGKQGVMMEVFDWRRVGRSEQEIRERLKARGYQASRINELPKKTRMTPAEVAADPS